MERDDARRVEPAAVGRRLGRDAEAERHVGHVHDDDARVGRGRLGDPAEAALEDVVAVEELHLGRGLEPDLWWKREKFEEEIFF